MASKIAIWNEALRLVNEPALSSDTDASDRQRVIGDAYPLSVRFLAEQGNWNFAITRAQLAQTATPPAFGFNYAYQLPNDFIRMVFVSPTGIERDDLSEYSVEGGNLLLCDSTSCYIRYVSMGFITGCEGSWTQSFADAVASDLALRAAPHFNLAGDRMNLLVKVNDGRLGNALAYDAMQDPPIRWNPGRWTTARFRRGPQATNGPPTSGDFAIP